MSQVEKVLIIGSGPAGYTAAIYSARANLSPLMIEGLQIGGQLTTTTEVENYPGFPDGIMGPDMMQLFRKQAEKFGTRLISQNVTKVDFSVKPFKIWVDHDEYQSLSVIIATGASAKLLGLPEETKLMGHGLSACATCDGFFFKNKKIGVVGGGDTAMEEATFLTKFASQVTVIHRRDKLRASKIMQEKAFKNPKIDFIWNAEIAQIYDVAKGRFTGVKIRDIQTQAVRDLGLEGLFIAIGHQPNTDLFHGQIKMNDVGYIDVVGRGTHTSVPGVFSAGDVSDHVYRQAVTAAGSGCMAAIDAERYLESIH